MKKKIFFFVMVMSLVFVMTGCTESVDISINDDLSGSCMTSIVMSEKLWEITGFSEMENTLIEANKQAGKEVNITKIDEGGIPSKKLEVKFSFKTIDELNKQLGGLTSITLNKNYAMLASTAALSQDSNKDMDEIKKQLEDELEKKTEPGSKEEKEQAETKALLDEMKTMKVDMTLKLPQKGIKTNGVLSDDGKTVVWSEDLSKISTDKDNAKKEENGILYVLFNENNSTVKPTFVNVTDSGLYNSGVNISVDSDNLIKSVNVKIKGKKDAQEFFSNEIYVEKTGEYTVSATDINNNVSEISFEIDAKKPTVKGVKGGKIYKTKPVIKFADKDSGVKKATLNNVKIKNNKQITKKGSYILKVEDKAGNVKIVKFKKI